MVNHKRVLTTWVGLLAVVVAGTIWAAPALAESGVHIKGNWDGTGMTRERMVSIINQATGGDSSLTVDLSRIPASMTEAELTSQMKRIQQMSGDSPVPAPPVAALTLDQGPGHNSYQSISAHKERVEASQRDAMAAISAAMNAEAAQFEMAEVVTPPVMTARAPQMAAPTVIQPQMAVSPVAMDPPSISMVAPLVEPMAKMARVASPTRHVAFSDSVAKGLREYYHGDFVGAADYFTEAIEDNPEDVAARFYLGYSHYSQGDHARAREAFRSAYAIDPQFSPVAPPTR